MTVTLLDGGMSREIVAHGGVLTQPEWSARALWDAPDAVVAAHRAFADAGARVMTTNAYALVPFHLGDGWSETRARDLSGLAVRLARGGAGGAQVAGCLPPPMGSYRPDLFEPAAAEAVWRPLIDGQAADVDLWLAETLSTVGEARLAARMVRDTGCPLWVAYTLLDDPNGPPRLRSGEPVPDAVAAARDAGAAAVLFNCSQPEVMGPAIRAASPAEGPVGAYANAFVRQHDDGTRDDANVVLSDVRVDLTIPAYADAAASWVDDGAVIVGGCCGVGASHIAAVADRLGISRSA